MNVVQQNNNKGGGSFFIAESGTKKAVMTYTWRNEKLMVIDHTEVDEKLQGKGIGQDLIDAAVNYAREKSIKIIPQCSYARHILESNKSLSDVLYES